MISVERDASDPLPAGTGVYAAVPTFTTWRVVGGAGVAEALVTPTRVPTTVARTTPDTTGTFTRPLRDITLLDWNGYGFLVGCTDFWNVRLRPSLWKSLDLSQTSALSAMETDLLGRAETSTRHYQPIPRSAGAA
jgi:hypothetical protein